MATLTSETIFTVAEAPTTYVETVDLVLYPQNTGTNALRELHYPGDTFPPIIYPDYPDKTENFDSAPWTVRPAVGADLTIDDVQIAIWQGTQKDRSIKEYWSGNETQSRMTAYFLRRLMEYYQNPPATDFITWWPKDRTAQGYQIIIESVSVGGADLTSFHFVAMKVAELIMYETILQFRIIGLVS